ncbi:helix-turn-helix transcriptional regulator [Bacillus sp. AFS076308]|nr:helix-turn-helix transcriptional regulator [Bacillus sp. AFS076308]
MKKHEPSTIGELIRQKRLAKKMSQDELALLCDITRKAMSNI